MANSDSQSSQHSGIFTLREWVAAVLLISIAVFVTLALGYRYIHDNKKHQLQSDAELVLSDVGERVIELQGVLNSMLGMHYASDEFAGLDISAFAEQLRHYSPFVRNIGMFGVVDRELRSEYEKYAAVYKDYTFLIHGPGMDGNATSDNLPSSYYPIISIDPLDQQGIDNLGFDLSTAAEMAQAIEMGRISGKGVILSMPDAWDMQGDALLLQPVYFAEQPPETEEDRLDLYAGGIWVSIDTTVLFSSAKGTNPASLDIAVKNFGGAPSHVYHHDLTDSSGDYVMRFGESRNARDWQLGESELQVLVKENLTLAYSEFYMLLGAMLLTAALGSAITVMVYQRRVVAQERVRSLEAINLERENAERTLDSISDAVIALTADSSIAFMNPAALEWFGIDTMEVMGLPMQDVLSIKSLDEANPAVLNWDELTHLMAYDEKAILDVVLPNSQKPESTYQLTISSMSSSEADAAGIILVLQDVSKERELTSELEHQAHHDPLTGVYNRFYFERCLEELVADVSISGREHALCYLDLDQFKIVNDTCGHPAGDRLLCELTEALTSRLRDHDVLVRLGGDEFGVIICDANPEEALVVAERLFEYFENAIFEHEGNVFPVRCSMGVVGISKDFDDLSLIMSSADIACYTAKSGGRNSLVVYSDSDESMANHKEDMNWLPRLERAIAQDEFRLLVQPIATLADNESVPASIGHYEYLLRLVDDDGSEIAPFRFIQAAERFALMTSIDRWVVNQAFKLVSEAGDTLDRDSSFAINLSGQSAADPEFLDYVAERIAHFDLDPSRFWFEITETAAITHFDNAVTLFKGLRKLGAKVALDDFGSGLSSFAYLRNLPVDVLKIDGQFVKDIATNDIAREMVRAMHHVAAAMELRTVAEFVEDQEVFDILRDMDIDYAQGYFIGKPMKFEVATELAQQSKAA